MKEQYRNEWDIVETNRTCRKRPSHRHSLPVRDIEIFALYFYYGTYKKRRQDTKKGYTGNEQIKIQRTRVSESLQHGAKPSRTETSPTVS